MARLPKGLKLLKQSLRRRLGNVAEKKIAAVIFGECWQFLESKFYSNLDKESFTEQENKVLLGEPLTKPDYFAMGMVYLVQDAEQEDEKRIGQLSLEKSREERRLELMNEGPLLYQWIDALIKKKLLKKKTHHCSKVKHLVSPFEYFEKCKYYHTTALWRKERDGVYPEVEVYPDAVCRACDGKGHRLEDCPYAESAQAKEKLRKYGHDMDEVSRTQVELAYLLFICGEEGCNCPHPHSKKDVTCGVCNQKGHETGDSDCGHANSVCKVCFLANRKPIHDGPCPFKRRNRNQRQ